MTKFEKILLPVCGIFLVITLITLKPLQNMNTCLENSQEQLYSDEMRKVAQAQDRLRACELGKENVQTLLACLDVAKQNSITRLTFSFI